MNGKKSSGDTPQFSKSRFAILAYLHKLRNWIKLLFLPDVAKRCAASELSDKLVIDGIISINGTKNEDFREVLTNEEVFRLNKLIAKLYNSDIEIKVEYRKLKNPLLI